MNDIEKRARELLAAELDKQQPGASFDAVLLRQGHTPGRQSAALRAISAALSAAPQVHTAENADLRKALTKCDCGCGRDVCADCGADLGFLPQAVPEDARQDAERYRWLRSLPVDASDRDGLDVVLWVDDLGGCPRGEDLDAEIDAVMLAAKPEPQA